MAMTIDQLQALMKGEGFRFYVDPSRPVLLSGGTGYHGQYQFIIALEVEGRFLQFRTQRYLTCPPGSPHLPATLKVLADLDYSLRFVKFAWDASDGEVVAYGRHLAGGRHDDAGPVQPVPWELLVGNRRKRSARHEGGGGRKGPRAWGR